MALPEIDYTTLTDEELDELAYDVGVEKSRRVNLAAIPVQMAALNVQYLETEGTVEGDAWRQPTGSHDAYPINWAVVHSNKNWVSLVHANVWEPGVSGWRESDGGEWPAWVQPTGSADSYPINSKVSHVDKHWISAVGNNVWEPGAAGTELLWTDADAPPVDTSEWPEWVQPTGGHDAYPIDAKVSHNGDHWISLIGSNVWEPGTAGTETLWSKQ